MQIRRATYADKPAIFEFLARAYAGRAAFKYPHRWAWAYENNPFLTGEDPPVWIAVAPDGRVVGQSAALVEPLVVDGQEHRVGWGVDFHVLPEFRGQGLGTQLQASNDAGNEIFMSLSMADAAAQIKTRLGLAPLPPVSRFSRILHHDPASVLATLRRRYSRVPEAVTRLAARPAARLLTRLGAPAEPRRTGEIAIQREAVFSEAFDRLWVDLGPAYRALVRRNAEYLTWKFQRQPHMQHEILGGYRSGSLAGYTVLRRARPPERNAGVLVDLFAHPQDEEMAVVLVGAALRRFFEQSVTYVTAATGVPAFEQALLQAGFRVEKTVTPLGRAGFPLPETGWLLGQGDHDWDQYPLA